MAIDANSLEAARQAKNKAKSLLQNVPHVSGVGITQVDERYAVKVNLEEDPDPTHPIPLDIDGVPVVIHRIGKVRKLDSRS
jgi:hypothetical protein